MKTRIDVIAGFLDSGKTTFLKYILSSGVREPSEKTVILLCEQGEEELNAEKLAAGNVFVETLQPKERPDEYCFFDLSKRYNPSRIFIEYNGTWSMEDFLKTRLPAKTYIGRILFIADAGTLLIHIRNMGTLASEQIANSDAVLLNRQQSVSPAQLSEIRQSIRNINRKTVVAFCPEHGKKWSLKKKYLLNTDEFVSVKATGIFFFFLFCGRSFCFPAFSLHRALQIFIRIF